jgi:hypothetical protein
VDLQIDCLDVSVISSCRSLIDRPYKTQGTKCSKQLAVSQDGDVSVFYAAFELCVCVCVRDL